MKLEKVKIGLLQTKNPQYLQLSLQVTDAIKEAQSLPRTGYAFCLLSKDEVQVLMDAGFKPFCKADIEAEFSTEPNENPLKPALLKFDLNEFKFYGGGGSWEHMFSAPPVAAAQPAAVPTPKSF